MNKIKIKIQIELNLFDINWRKDKVLSSAFY